jgi:predicted dehydrogenase
MKLLIVGNGMLGKTYAHAARQAADVQLLGITEALDSTCGADWALLCASQDQQADLATRAADLGMDVLLPLPLAASRKDADALFAYFERRGRWLLPACEERYRGNVRDVKKHFQAGTIGQIGMAEMKRTVPLPSDLEDRSVPVSGGAVYHALLPDVETLLYWLGGVKHAYGYHRTGGQTDFAVLTVELQCGAIACLEGLWGGSEPYCRAYELSGSGGNLSFSSALSEACLCYAEGGKSALLATSPDQEGHNPYASLLEDVARNAVDVAECKAHLLEAYRVVETCLEGKP